MAKVPHPKGNKTHHPPLPTLKLNTKTNNTDNNNNNNIRPVVWDCDSNLYDSFELKSFERQLYSAIHSRSLSMPHLSDRRLPETVVAPPFLPPLTESKKQSKISRSLNKFIKSMFKSKQSSTGLFRLKNRPGHEYYVVYDKSGALSTIPEVPEIDFGGLSPEINSLVRRAGSERFAETSVIGISCA